MIRFRSNPTTVIYRDKWYRPVNELDLDDPVFIIRINNIPLADVVEYYHELEAIIESHVEIIYSEYEEYAAEEDPEYFVKSHQIMAHDADTIDVEFTVEIINIEEVKGEVEED